MVDFNTRFIAAEAAVRTIDDLTADCADGLPFEQQSGALIVMSSRPCSQANGLSNCELW